MIYNSPYTVKNPENTYKKLNSYNGVIIFGTGNCGAIVLDTLKKIGINIVCLTDNNKHKWGKKIRDLEVIPPDQIKKKSAECKNWWENVCKNTCTRQV